MEYGWNMYGICIGYVWNMYGICMEHVWNMDRICMGYAWNMYVICMEYVSNLPILLLHPSRANTDATGVSFVCRFCTQEAWWCIGVELRWRTCWKCARSMYGISMNIPSMCTKVLGLAPECDGIWIENTWNTASH